MTRLFGAIGIALLVSTSAGGQEPTVDIPPIERKAFSLGGYVELRPAIVWLDSSAALFKLRSAPGDQVESRNTQMNARLQLDAGYNRSWFSAQTRTLVEGGFANRAWSRDASVYEAYVSVKPSPAFTLDAGKKTLKWGKGYLWNPAAFLDRAKSAEDPALALEGFVVLSADYIRTFGGPLQVLSVTPVLLPVSSDLNASFGDGDHVNVAGKVYLLFWDTDIDVMYLSGGSRPARFGFDLSRNLRSNVELHAEWARVPRAVTMVLAGNDALIAREQPATNVVLGLRYLTKANTTFIADFFHSASGYTPAEAEQYFDLIQRGYDSLTIAGDVGLLGLARRATEAGYGRMNPMRNYAYARISQPDALGVLYLMLGASAIVNLDDRSYSLLPEVQYKPAGNLELRALANIQRGEPRSEFGEKRAIVRLELRARYSF
ncbi:MAG TPA: hypothetical protein VF981_16995 [Gemmatimonadaceae bacterium]